jgi:hypothetical protein
MNDVERCEWNPVLDMAAESPHLDGDCENEATLSVGSGRGFHQNWHLCESCAKRPRFRRYRVRVRIGQKATKDGTWGKRIEAR